MDDKSYEPDGRARAERVADGEISKGRMSMATTLVKMIQRSRGRAALAFAAFVCGMIASIRAARAQDLSSGVSSAASELKGVIKIGLAVAAVIIVAVGLVVTALKFSRKDPEAIWFLLGTGAGSVLCGIAAAML